VTAVGGGDIGNQVAGTAFSITISAMDQYNAAFTSYTGTAGLSYSGGTIIPTSTTGDFTAGVWTGSVTLTGTGTGVHLTATDGIVTGDSNNFDVSAAAPVLNHFHVTAVGGGDIGNQVAGTAFSITITAIDQYGATFTGYSGPNTLGVSVGTIDPITTTAFSGGAWSGQVTLNTAGTDIYISTSGGGKAGTSNTFDVSAAPPAFHHFTMTGYPASVLKGQSFGDVVVTACDQYGAPFTSYAGDVYFESSDPLVVLPYHALSKYTYVPATDNGVHTFDGFMLNTEGPQTITVTDGTKSTVSDPPITVNAAPVLNHFEIGTISGSQTAGTAFSITITAKDQYDVVYTGYAGPATLTYSAGSISPSSASPFVSGVWTGPVTVTKASTGVTIQANDGSIIGTSNVFDVNPAPLDHFNFETISTQNAGNPFSITITAVDTYDNLVTSYIGTPTLTCSAGVGTITPTDIGAFSGGTGNGLVTITKSGASITITATDGLTTGTSNTFTVNPGVVASIDVTPATATVTAGAAQTYTATASDAYGNTWDVTASTAWSIVEAGHGGSWTGNVYTSANTGTWTVRGDYSGNSDTATLNVNNAAVSSITVTPDPATITAGETQAYTATASDAYGNTWDVTASTAWGIDAGAGGSWSGNVYTSQKASAVGTPWTVTGTYSAVSGTAQLTVNTIKFQVTFDYTVSGSGAPTAPTVSYVSQGQTLTVTAGPTATVMADLDSTYTYSPNPLTGSSGTERWQAASTPTGTITGAGTISPTYYHQYQVTFQYTISGTPAGSPTNPTATYTKFGASTTNTATRTTPPSDWVDAGSAVTYTNPLGSGSERWKISPEASSSPYTVIASVASSQTANPTYYHQYEFTVTASPAGAIGGKMDVLRTRFGTTATAVSVTTVYVEYADAGTTVTVSSPQSPVGSYTFSSYTNNGATMNSVQTITIVYTAADTTAPTVSNVQVSPASGPVGQVFTITADVSDPSGVETVIAYLEKPDETHFTSVTMSDTGGGHYSGTYTSTAAGSYLVDIEATDNLDNKQEYDNDISLKVTTTMTLRPNENGFYSNLGRNTGSNNYQCVDESGTPTDTDYVYQYPNGENRDTYNMEDPPVGQTGIITQITVHAVVRLNGATGHCHLAVRTGTTDTTSSEQSLTPSYVDKTASWSTKPGTSSAWAWADITSLQCGIVLNRISGGMGDSVRCTQVWVVVEYIPP
jgi:hypothetical protein